MSVRLHVSVFSNHHIVLHISISVAVTLRGMLLLSELLEFGD